MTAITCPDWDQKAICRCGCQSRALKRKFIPESQTWAMNWGSPRWLSQETQAILDGYLPDDYDPALKLPKPRLPDEFWLGDRQVTAEEFERACVEDEERERRELEQHVRESAENLLGYINHEGGARTLQDLRFSETGSLAALVLTLDKERRTEMRRRDGETASPHYRLSDIPDDHGKKRSPTPITVPADIPVGSIRSTRVGSANNVPLHRR